MSRPHVYGWARQRGFFGRGKAPVSHLLLDGGVLSVPLANTPEFTAAYAVGVIRQGAPRPCVVEVRSDVFRMFYDLDAVVKQGDTTQLAAGVIPDGIDAAIRAVCIATLACFDATESTIVTVCASNQGKAVERAAKHGIHLTFSNVFVKAATARLVRQHVLGALDGQPNPFLNEWSQIVDEAVFKGSGMRLPWSAKKGDPDRVYVPIAEYTFGGDSVSVTRLDPAAIAQSVTAARELLARVTLRSSVPPTAPKVHVVESADRDSSPSDAALTHASLREFANVLPAIEAAIPESYAGRVTAVMRGEHAVLFRHSSKWCANVGREHHSSNTYFMLTRKGLQQCCYSRKGEESDRKWGSCADFRGELLKVPQAIIDELLPELPSALPPPPPLPSQATKITFEALVARSRPKQPAKRRKTKKDPSTGDELNPFAMAKRCRCSTPQ